jgi:hypothetical protein
LLPTDSPISNQIPFIFQQFPEFQEDKNGFILIFQ